MFNVKRVKSLEERLGLIYKKEKDYQSHEELKYGDLADIEKRLKKLEDLQGIDKYGGSIKK